MPSKSPAQARFMAAAAHDKAFAAKAGIPQSVAKEFNEADKGSGIRQKKEGDRYGGAYVSGTPINKRG